MCCSAAGWYCICSKIILQAAQLLVHCCLLLLQLLQHLCRQTCCIQVA
jgi:hypothetical protein